MIGISSQIEEEYKETTAQIMMRDPIYGRKQGLAVIDILNKFPRRRGLPQDPSSLPVSQWPPAPTNYLVESLRSRSEGNIQRGRPGDPHLPQGIGTQWTSVTQSEVSLNPPDTQIGVGPTQVLTIINGYIRVHNKNGVMGSLNTTTDSFFNSVRGGNFVGDSRVRYDNLASRWVLSSETFTYPNRILLAYSDGPTITNTTVWTFFFFQQDQVGTVPNVDAGRLADYQTMGVDEDGIIIGANMFLSGFQGCSIWVLRKSDVYDGAPYTVTPFRGITSASGNGVYAPHHLSNDLVGNSTSYIFGTDNVTFGRLVLRRLTNVDSFAPVLGPNVNIAVPNTVSPQSVSVLGSSATVSAVDDRIMEAEIRLNRVTNTRSLWACHQIEVNSTGVADTTGSRNAVRWYQIDNLNGTPNLIQSGTLWDSAATNPTNYWMSGINMSGQGHMAILPSAAGVARRLEIVAAGRLRNDALGTTQAPTLVIGSSTNYGPGGRWGDYAAVRVDPQDEQTLWGAQQYCNATNSWAIRVVKLTAPPPGIIIGVSPNNLTQGQSGNVLITIQTVGSKEFYDTQAGLNRLSAAFSGTGITVNSVTWTSVSQATLNVTVSPSATPGTRTVTVTNPDGQSTTSAELFTVNALNPVPSVTSMSPINAIVQSGAFTLNVTGGGFNSSSIVRWNGSNRTTTFVSSSQLQAAIPATDLSMFGTATVTVFNPAPGGGTSGPLTFTINPRSISGTITLQGWVASPSGIPITFRVRPVGGTAGTEFLTTVFNLDSFGGYVLNTSLAPGNYDVLADGSIWLRRRVSNINLTGLVATGVNFTLPVGDIDGDGEITNSDYSIWAVNNGNSVAPGTNGDLDGDGDVTNADYALWAANNGFEDIP